MSLIQNARKPTLSAVRSCSRVRYNSSAASEPPKSGSAFSSLFAKLEDNAGTNNYRGVEVQNIKSPKPNAEGASVWKNNTIKLDNSMRIPYRSRPRSQQVAPGSEGQAADPDAAARIMGRQADHFAQQAPRDSESRPPRDGQPRTQRNGEPRTQRNGEPRTQRTGEPRTQYTGESRTPREREPRTPRDGDRRAGPRDGERRGRREGSLNDRVKQAGSDKIKQTGPRHERQRDDASAEPARERPVRAATKAAPLRMSAFRTAHFGNVFNQPTTDTPATREAEVLRALEVPKENSEVLVVKPRKKDVTVEKGVRKVKKRVVMRGSKRITIDPRVRPVLERYGGDYSRVAPRSALSGLNKPKQPLAYARAALTLRPYLSRARRTQALDIIEKHAREARAVV